MKPVTGGQGARTTPASSFPRLEPRSPALVLGTPLGRPLGRSALLFTPSVWLPGKTFLLPPGLLVGVLIAHGAQTDCPRACGEWQLL